MSIKGIKKIITQNLGYIAVALVCIIFMLTAFLSMGRTGKTIGEIITDGAVFFFMGCLVTRMLDLQGLSEGERDERVLKTLQLHGETVESISAHIEELDDWCDEKNETALKMQRKKILARECLKYSDCFGDDGIAKPFKFDESKMKNKFLAREERRRYRCYTKAVRLKLTPLSSSDLTSEGGRADDPNFLGRTKVQYETQTRTWDIFMRLGTAFVFGYYAVDLLDDFSYANIIWRALQVAMLLLMGTIRRNMSYSFMTDEYRSRVIKKIDFLQKFKNDMKKKHPEEVGESDSPPDAEENKTEKENTDAEHNGI